MGGLVYYSSTSENTHRFVQKLGLGGIRLPVGAAAALPLASQPYVLVLPTFGGHDGKGSVPKPVIHFLNVEANRSLIRGVIAGGNTNFGTTYCMAGNIVSSKCAVPLLYRFELLGTDEDVANVRQGLEQFWTRSH